MALGGLGAKDILIQLKGDNKNLKNAMTDSDKSMGNLTNSVKKYGPAMVAAFAVGTAAFVGMAVKMAAAEEVVNRQTESMLKSQGIMWSSVKGEVTDYINELEKLTAYGDTDLQMAFNRMSSSGMGYAATMENMKMVTDIAYTRNIDLVAAADLVAKAYNGQGSALKRYGIILGEGLTGMEAVAAMQLEVSKNFADASDRADTLEGSMDLLTTATDDFMEALGDPMTGPLADFVDVMAEGTGEADGFATKIGELGAWFTEGFLMPKDLMMPFRVELQKIDEMEDQTFEDRQRRNQILYEMQYGTYRSRKALIEDIKKAEEGINDAEESTYFTQLRKMGASDEYINSLKQQLEVEEAITTEGEKQLLSMRERARLARAAIQSIPGVEGKGGRGGFAGVSSDELRGLRQTEDVKVGYKRPSGQWTITGGTKSGAP